MLVVCLVHICGGCVGLLVVGRVCLLYAQYVAKPWPPLKGVVCVSVYMYGRLLVSQST